MKTSTISTDGDRNAWQLNRTWWAHLIMLWSLLTNLQRRYKQVMNSDDKHKWMQAMNDELQAHEKNGTWSIVPCTDGMNIIGSRWIYKVKRDADGNVSKYKARLVAQGFNQQYGIDYQETFAPVLKYKSLRLLSSHYLSFTAQQHNNSMWKLHSSTHLYMRKYMCDHPIVSTYLTVTCWSWGGHCMESNKHHMSGTNSSTRSYDHSDMYLVPRTRAYIWKYHQHQTSSS